MKDILTIIRQNDRNQGGLISILEEIQDAYTHLPETALRQVAEETGHSLADIYGVATFYKAFSLKPGGKHRVSACLGTACHVRGAQKIVEKFVQQLGIEPGGATPDNEITFETVNCLGACALGPIVVADGRCLANVTSAKVKKIIRDTKKGTIGLDRASKACEFPMKAFCPRCNRSLMDGEHRLDGHPSIRIAISMNGKSGWARMSALYGNFGRFYEHEVPPDSIVSLLCPHCLSLLKDSTGSCLECGAPLASLTINGGDGVLRLCTRAGCKGHLLELNGTPL